MSGHKLMRGHRIAKLAAAVVVVGGVPALLEAHPYVQPANSGSTVHWFADWKVNTNPAPTDFFTPPFTTTANVGAVKTALQTSASSGHPTGIKITNAALSSSAAKSLFNSTFAYGSGI